MPAGTKQVFKYVVGLLFVSIIFCFNLFIHFPSFPSSQLGLACTSCIISSQSFATSKDRQTNLHPHMIKSFVFFARLPLFGALHHPNFIHSCFTFSRLSQKRMRHSTRFLAAKLHFQIKYQCRYWPLSSVLSPSLLQSRLFPMYKHRHLSSRSSSSLKKPAQ